MIKRQFGFSYMEVLVATVLIVIVLVPSIEALQGGVRGSAMHRQASQIQYRVLEKMEQTLARPFSDLVAEADIVADPTTPVPAPYSDTAGIESRRLVFLAHYDGDNADGDDNPFTGTDAGLIWVRITIENSPRALETLARE